MLIRTTDREHLDSPAKMDPYTAQGDRRYSQQYTNATQPAPQPHGLPCLRRLSIEDTTGPFTANPSSFQEPQYQQYGQERVQYPVNSGINDVSAFDNAYMGMEMGIGMGNTSFTEDVVLGPDFDTANYGLGMNGDTGVANTTGQFSDLLFGDPNYGIPVPQPDADWDNPNYHGLPIYGDTFSMDPIASMEVDDDEEDVDATLVDKNWDDPHFDTEHIFPPPGYRLRHPEFDCVRYRPVG
jgi:hypothetical protein